MRLNEVGRTPLCGRYRWNVEGTRDLPSHRKCRRYPGPSLPDPHPGRSTTADIILQARWHLALHGAAALNVSNTPHFPALDRVDCGSANRTTKRTLTMERQ